MINRTAHCPALFITAPASGQGKTTITAALARYLGELGKVVRIFKTGPDYLDPQILEQASGQPVVQLDLWMAGTQWCQAQLHQAACHADVILIEGAMGMFDGAPSSADLAAQFGIPMLLIINSKGMAQTTAAVALGLANYRHDVQVLGLIANQCSTERHRELIANTLPDTLPLLATFAFDDELSLPERHLGLVQASEVSDELEVCFTNGVNALKQGGIAGLLPLLQPVAFAATSITPAAKLLAGKRIVIARDAAFSFIYQANVQLLEQMGAQIRYFSPLNDATLPEGDAIWLPGGYPELHAEQLAANVPMLQALRQFYAQNGVILAECGGFLYCLDALTDLQQQRHNLLGLLAGEGLMRGKRGCQGMQTARLPEGEVRAHAHHRSRSDCHVEPISYGQRQHHVANGEAIYRQKGLTASYLHLFFPSNPTAIAQLLLGATCSQPSLLTGASHVA